LIEGPTDPKTSAQQIGADFIEEGLTFIQFHEAELYIDEVDLIQLLAAFKDAKLSTLDVHLEQDWAGKILNFYTVVKPPDADPYPIGGSDTEGAFLAASGL